MCCVPSELQTCKHIEATKGTELADPALMNSVFDLTPVCATTQAGMQSHTLTMPQ